MGRPVREPVLPYHVVVAVLIADHLEGEEPERRRFQRFLVQELAVGSTPEAEAYVSRRCDVLQELLDQADAADNLYGIFHGLALLLQAPEKSQSATLAPRSALGLFVRRCVSAFSGLDFQDVCQLSKALVSYLCDSGGSPSSSCRAGERDAARGLLAHAARLRAGWLPLGETSDSYAPPPSLPAEHSLLSLARAGPSRDPLAAVEALHALS
ncbi:hypothetical protein H632_c3334p0, partial [Helicosporidium sp. ATCC 50920]